MPDTSARRSRSEADFESWLARFSERADPFMAWLGVVFALIVGFQLVATVRPPLGHVLTIVSWVIWALFLIEFVVKLALAPAKGRFLRRHWIQALGLLVPTLRLFNLFRLLRLGRALPAGRVLASSYRGADTARRVLTSRLAYLGGVATVITISLAQLGYLFENRWTLPTFGDALIWAATIVVGMQAQPVPATRPGQIVMLFGFATGVVLIAALAGTLGAFLIEGRNERSGRSDKRQ